MEYASHSTGQARKKTPQLPKKLLFRLAPASKPARPRFRPLFAPNLGSDQAKLFKYRKKYFKNHNFLCLERYFWYQEMPYKKYGSAQIGLKQSFYHQKRASKA